jgi:hypothetical protein
MAKRIRLASEDLVSPQYKRIKISIQESGAEIYKAKNLSPSKTEEDFTGSNDKQASETEELSSPNLEQQPAGEDSVTVQSEELKLPTREPGNDKGLQENLSPTSNNTQSPAATSEITTHQKDNRNNPGEIQQQPPAPEPKLPNPKSGIETERPAFKERKDPKKSKKEPEFKIFEDETATRDGITEHEDENFSFAMNRVHEFVDDYFRKEGFLYGEEVVDWIMPMAKKVDEAKGPANGTSLEKGLLQWKQDKRFNHWQATRWSKLTTKEWFGADDVEELAEMVERIILTAQEEENVEVKELGKNYPRGRRRSEALMICGYCQGEGFGADTRRDAEYYARLGRAWGRIVEFHFDVDVWDMSAEMVKNLTWDKKMMEKILASKGWIRNLKLLRTRWATTHPSAVVRTPLQDEPRGTLNRSSGHPWAEWSFEEGLDYY